jgi:arabinogalactan oligomer/maltooligosaccharide transport system substrate-binding protein
MSRTFMHRIAPMLVVGSLVLAACAGGEITPGDDESEAPAESGAGSAPPDDMAFPEGDVTIELWTKEGDAQLDFVETLAADYMALHDNVTIEVVNKDVELLREDMVNTALSPDAQPDLLWTVLDHVGPFVEAGVIQPLGEDDYDTSVLVDAASRGELEGETYAAPINTGNQLMLYWNKSLIGEEPPADTDEFSQVAIEQTTGDKFGLVFNTTESFWLIPWLYGFGGSVFEDDGVTPSLDTPEMQAALEFLHGLKYEDGVMPETVDYPIASDLFTTGDAAMIINGDWELGNYAELLGDDLGVGPLPEVTDTGELPKPFTAGSFYMVPSAVEGDTLTVVHDFINFTLAAEQQRALVEDLVRLPSNAEVLEDPAVTEDPLLAGSGEALAAGVPQPINVEMRCVFDAMTAGVRDVLASGNSDVAAVAATMQDSALNCIETGA